MDHEQPVLVLAPTGRDGQLIAEVLGQADLPTRVCGDLPDLVAAVGEEAGAILLTEEALNPVQLPQLITALDGQPTWSDIPLIILTVSGELAMASQRLVAMFGPSGNVTLLERPLRPTTLISATAVALRSRRRQYLARALLSELSRSNSALQEFAAAASHDMREPLRMISNYLDLLKRRNPTLDPASVEYLDYAVDGSRRMAHMITGLLDFAKVAARELELKAIPADEALADALANLSQAIGESHATVTHDSLPQVHADRALLSQVFQNLIGNGLKFCRERPRVHVTASMNGNTAIIAVADNGIGIPADQRDRLFKVFQRLHGPHDFPGTGIGLATCLRIVERHGGHIWVESEEGHGSTFKLTLAAAG